MSWWVDEPISYCCCCCWAEQFVSTQTNGTNMQTNINRYKKPKHRVERERERERWLEWKGGIEKQAERGGNRRTDRRRKGVRKWATDEQKGPNNKSTTHVAVELVWLLRKCQTCNCITHHINNNNNSNININNNSNRWKEASTAPSRQLTDWLTLAALSTSLPTASCFICVLLYFVLFTANKNKIKLALCLEIKQIHR